MQGALLKLREVVPARALSEFERRLRVEFGCALYASPVSSQGVYLASHAISTRFRTCVPVMPPFQPSILRVFGAAIGNRPSEVLQ